MLEVLNRFAHGFVALPVLQVLRKRGYFPFSRTPSPFEQIASNWGANPGHLRVAFRLLESLGVISSTSGHNFSAGISTPFNDSISNELIHRNLDEIVDIYQTPIDALLPEKGNSFVSWIDQVVNRWGFHDSAAADLYDGPVLVPLLLALSRRADENSQLVLEDLDEPVRFAIIRLFEAKQWGLPGGAGVQLNDAGQYLLERAPINETVHSYGAMLQRMDELLFGDAEAVFAHNAQGHETHVDRSSNVIGSGFQHGKFFAEMDDIFVEIFNREPLENQPRYVADMGCGDGALLKRIYDVVRRSTARGRALDEYPLQMIALDFNEKALQQTARTLEGIPHLLIRADIGNPTGILEELHHRGIPEDQVLHVRSFLDHDRPFIPPTNADAVNLRSRIPAHNVSVDLAGKWIQPAAVVESLVRHLDGWSGVINRHGFVILEVHCLPPAMVRRYFDQSESLHFDAYHGFSLQHLVEAQVFHLALAEVGLFPRSGYSRRFPRTVPFTRITLDWLEKRDYTIRNAVPADLPALNDLEAQCWPSALRTKESELAARLDRFPEGQFVLEQRGRIVAVLYSQRIETAAVLDSATYQTVPTLHTADGPVLQLLGLNVAPDAQDQNLGSELADVVTRWCVLRGDIESIVGVTRCKDYQRRGTGSFEEYVRTTADGLPIDPILRFHTSRGASIRKILSGYRPEDTDNLGHGIAIEYQIRDRVESTAVSPLVQVRGEDDIESALAGCIRHLLNSRRHSAYATDVPLRDMGMDSLDLMELRILLNRRFQVELDSSFFFEHSTPAAIAEYLAKGVAVPVRRTADRVTVPTTQTVSDKAVAIVGMSCRFPGSIETPDAYWETLKAGVTTPNHLEKPSHFDAAFFRISPREANHLDPQQRILLEQSWRALEDAGIDPSSLAGQPVGVFTGIFSHDYEILSLRGGTPGEAQPYLATGNAAAIASGRVAYFLDLRGPAISVDTACSSSLVAVHLACQSLHAGDCRIALASGVNLILTPDLTQTFAEAGMLAKDGKCKTFDAAADGYVRSEGCVVVVLKLLSQAISDGDEILAVICGSAINQDGASNGLTAPNASAQHDVIRRALENAGIAPHEVSYVEAHGTGTALGDPVEVKALAAYSEGRSAGHPLLVGSVKTNLGHTEAAAGLAGLMKVVLGLRHRHIPRHLHFAKINPNITLNGAHIAISSEAQQWVPGATGRRLAGVSSFGFSGTNAHIILEEAPTSRVPEMDVKPCHLLALSATSENALGQLVNDYANYLDTHAGVPLAEVCATVNAGRKHFRHRWTAIAESAEEMRSALQSFPSSTSGELAAPKIAFLYTGQGSQYANMGRGLYEVSPVFREAIDRCAGLLGDRLGVALLDLLYGSASHLLAETRFTQPALFCFEYALTELWRSYGIVPAAVAGHSAGEFAAAVTAGILSLEEGITLIAERARLMHEAPRGAMLVVFANERIAQAAVRGYEREVAVAVFNTPNNVVISGAEVRIAALEESFRQTGIRTLRLNVSHAFHSPLMDGVLEPLIKAAEKVEHRAPVIPFVSNLTGGFAVPTPDYWAQHVRNPVRFSQGIATLLQNGCNVFLEIGPRPTLVELGRACTGQKDIDPKAIEWISSLRPGHHDWRQMLECVSVLYRRGQTLDWQSIENGTRRRTGLPGHPFIRQPYWLPSSSTGAQQSKSLLGTRLNSPLQQFESTIGGAAFDDHQVEGRPLMPAAAYLELARAAATTSEELAEVEIEQPLYMTGPATIQTVITDAGTKQLTVYSHHEDGWRKHCIAQLVPKKLHSAEPLETIRRRITRDLDPAIFYRDCEEAGVVYGSTYRAIGRLWVGANESLGEIRSHAAPEAALDAALQIALATRPQEDIPLPVSVKRFQLADQLPGNFWSHARTRQDETSGALIADVTIYSVDGEVLANVEGLLMRFRTAKRAWEKWLYQVEWKPQPVAAIQPADIPVPANASWYASAAAAVNELSVSFVKQAFQELGGADSRGQVHTRHRKLFDRLLSIARASQLNHHEPLAHLATVRARFPEAFAELDLLERCGPNLAAVLRGDRDPIELLFPKGDTSACRRLYAESPAFAERNAVLAQTVGAAATAHSGKVRILEIGAGTGAATEAILPHLPAERTEYTFTDVSGLFLTLAAERFCDYPFLTYRQLDIESPQDFEPHSFDIVIASNVLHATADLAQSLRNVKRLLAPGGTLVLLEVSRPQLWIDLVFGLLDGWWRFADSDLRKDYPLLSAGKWQALLEREGFTVTSNISGGPSVYDQIVIAGKLPSKSRSWLIVNGGTKLVRELESVNVQVTHAPVSVASSLVSEPCNHFDDVIYLCGKDEPAWIGALELVQAMIAGRSQARLWLVTRNAISVAVGDSVSGFAEATLWGLGKVIAQEHPEFRCTLLDLDDDSYRASNLKSELLRTDDEREIAIRSGVRQVPRLVRWNLPIAQVLPAEPFRLETALHNGLDSLEFRPASRRTPHENEIEIRVTATGLNFRDVLTAMGMYPGAASPLGVECSGRVERVGSSVTNFCIGDEVIAIGTGTFSQFVTVPVHCAALKPASLSTADAGGVAIPFLTASYALEELGQMKAGDRVLIHSAAGGVGLAAVQLAQRAGAEVYATASESKWNFLRSQGVRHVYDSRTPDFADRILEEIGGTGIDIVLNSLTGELASRSFALLREKGYFIDVSKSKHAPEQTDDLRYHRFDLLELAPAKLQQMLDRLANDIERGELTPVPTNIYPMTDVVSAFDKMRQAKHIGKIVVAQRNIDSQGTYLITGGASGLGLAIAQYLIEQGAKHLILIGRRAPTTALPGAAQFRQADVTRSEDIVRVLDEIAASGHPLRGVIHAAGVLDDAMLVDQSPERFQKVLDPKVTGAWNLHNLTRSERLEFFILFSSIASVTGSPGQANHAAANAFLDSLAAYRRALGLPAMSINWGAWSGIGSAAGSSTSQRLKSKGLEAMVPEEGIAAFSQLLRSQAVQTVVLPMDWSRFFDRHNVSPYFEFLRERRTESASQTERRDLNSLVESVPETQRHSVMLQELRSMLRNVLGMASGSPVPPKQGFFELGLDSLGSVQLRNMLQKQLNRPLPSSLLFDYPNLDVLASHLLGGVIGANFPAEARVVPDTAQPEYSDLDSLSEEEAERTLLERLERIGSA